MTNTDRANYLAYMTTKDAAGTHFTHRYSREVLDHLEKGGYIKIYKPVHTSGIPYDDLHWTVEVTQTGIEYVDLYYDPSRDDFNDLDKMWA